MATRDGKGRFIKGHKGLKPNKQKKAEMLASELVDAGALIPEKTEALIDLEAAALYYKKEIAKGNMEYWDKLVEVAKFRAPYEKPRVKSIESTDNVISELKVSWEAPDPIPDDHPLSKLLNKE